MQYLNVKENWHPKEQMEDGRAEILIPILQVRYINRYNLWK
jgi:hypothetical protein